MTVRLNVENKLEQTTAYIENEQRPRITLIAEDYSRLSTLAHAASDRIPALASTLGDELDRAHVLPRGCQPESVVRMGSEVTFRDETSGKVQAVTLVYPDKADIAKGRISVLTPIGTALIGVDAGASITWRTRSDELKRLTVLHIHAREAA